MKALSQQLTLDDDSIQFSNRMKRYSICICHDCSSPLTCLRTINEHSILPLASCTVRNDLAVSHRSHRFCLVLNRPCLSSSVHRKMWGKAKAVVVDILNFACLLRRGKNHSKFKSDVRGARRKSFVVASWNFLARKSTPSILGTC